MNKKLLMVALPLMLILGGCSQQAPVNHDTTVVAKISVTPTIVANMETPISAAGSMGSADETLHYAYDVDGDGIFETEGSETYPATLYHTFKEPGDYKVSVEVTDTKGKSDIATKEFTVYPIDYLNVDKKSELETIVTAVGKKVTISTKVSTDRNLSIRLYSPGTTALSAGTTDIKNYPSWNAIAGTVDTHEIDVSDLTPGEYNGTVSSDAGPEKNITVVIH